MNLCFAFFIFEGGKKNNKQTKEEEKNLYITACTRLNAFVHSNEQHFFFGLFFLFLYSGEKVIKFLFRPCAARGLVL